MTDGMSIADVMALAKDGDNDGGFGGGSFVWVFFLFFLLAWGGNGGMFGGNGANNAAVQGALTRAELTDGLSFQGLQSSITNVGNGLCNLGYTQLEQFNQTQMGMMQGFNGVQSGITQLGYNMQSCC